VSEDKTYRGPFILGVWRVTNDYYGHMGIFFLLLVILEADSKGVLVGVVIKRDNIKDINYFSDDGAGLC